MLIAVLDLPLLFLRSYGELTPISAVSLFFITFTVFFVAIDGQIAVDGTDIYVTGSAGSSFSPSAPLAAHAGGGRDVFLVKITDGATPTPGYTTFVGSDGDETANAITIDNGKVYLAGGQPVGGDAPADWSPALAHSQSTSSIVTALHAASTPVGDSAVGAGGGASTSRALGVDDGKEVEAGALAARIRADGENA